MDDKTLARLAPEYRAYMERLHAARAHAPHSMPIAEVRDLMREMQNADVSSYPVTAEWHALDGFSVQILRPAALKAPLPVVVFLHGGGWVLGDAITHARMVRVIAAESQAAVVFVDYERAPEAHFPLALEQCYRALQWVMEHGPSIELDSSRLVVAGDSAGGNLAAAAVLLAVRRGGPAIRMQALLYPVTDCDFNTPSYRDFSIGLNLDLPTMQWFWEKYLPDKALRIDPLASPLRASEDELKRLPPALVVTAECDVLRDEGEAFARKLAVAGVPVTAVRFLGTLHGFMMVDDLAHSAQAVAAMNLLAMHVRQALHDDFV